MGMKLFAIALGCAAAFEPANKCDYTELINDQIQKEMEASNFYYALHFKFSSQKNHRPKFAEMLAKRAAEERDHATMLAEFQLSRGADVEIRDVRKPSGIWEITEIKSMEDALDKMIEKEKNSTKDLLDLNTLAEDGKERSHDCNCKVNEHDPLVIQDSCKAPHLSDLMTGTYLPEQLADIHELKKLKSQLEHYSEKDHDLKAEILFDKLIL